MVTVSVLMPIKNAEKYVYKAINSILSQTFYDLELLIIDDGSTDRSIQIAQQFGDSRIKIICGKSRGVANCFNQGLKGVNGAYLVRCDADDYFPFDRLSWQLEWLQKHETFGAVCGKLSTLEENGELLANLNHGNEAQEITDELKGGQCRTSFCTWMVRSEYLFRIGGCRDYFITSEDIDLQYRLSGVCRIWFEPRITYYYRLHKKSITHTQDCKQREFFEQTARKFCLQRQQNEQDDLELGNPPCPPSPSLFQTSCLHKQIQGMLVGRAWQEFKNGHKWNAIKIGLRACLYNPVQINSWKSFVALILKKKHKI